MAKNKKDPLLEALKEGRSYTWTIPEGGNLASMRKAVKHGQTLTMSPVDQSVEVQVGDLVLVKWHQGDIFHIVGEIKDDQYLIVNSLGKINGWVGKLEILGKVTKIIEPEPCPDVPVMLEQLDLSYRKLVEKEHLTDKDAQRLYSIVHDLQWYAERIRVERWDIMPRDNIWSFQQNLWKLLRQSKDAIQQETVNAYKIIDQGKKCVGLASEFVLFFENENKS